MWEFVFLCVLCLLTKICVVCVCVCVCAWFLYLNLTHINLTTFMSQGLSRNFGRLGVHVGETRIGRGGRGCIPGEEEGWGKSGVPGLSKINHIVEGKKTCNILSSAFPHSLFCK